VIAIVQVGDNKSILSVENVHYYWFEKNITECELKKEIEDLRDVYDIVLLQVPTPDHIREVRVIV
jgi:5,10-methylene-tetrahydrofolate dehydrogenase/methenyl tetrahydrofolate cyclohydrolase